MIYYMLMHFIAGNLWIRESGVMSPIFPVAMAIAHSPFISLALMTVVALRLRKSTTLRRIIKVGAYQAGLTIPLMIPFEFIDNEEMLVPVMFFAILCCLLSCDLLLRVFPKLLRESILDRGSENT